jgi:hypothetical protein
MEFVSIVGRAAVEGEGPDTHDYTVLRARRGLPARAWAGTTQVWILPLDNITPLRHPDMGGLLLSGEPGYLRLTAFTPFAEDDSPTIPERTFVFPPAFDVAPRIAWVNPAGSTAETDAGGDVTLEFTVTDRQGDLASIRVDSRRDDATMETTHLNLAFPATGLRTIVLPLNFAGHASEYRIYVVRVEARDQNGNPAIQSRTIIRPPTGTPATPAPPSFSPPDGFSFYGSLGVTISSAPGTQIEWAVVSIGAPAPGSGTVFPGYETTINITSSRRVWARAVNSPAESPWVYADFYKDTNDGGTTPLIP